MAKTNWAITQAAKEGNRAAFAKLWNIYYPEVVKFYKNRNWYDPEDLASETFVRAFKAIRAIENRNIDIEAWFMTIARNLWRDKIKSSQYKKEVFFPEIFISGQSISPESIMLEKELQKELELLILRLPINQQAVIRLFYLEYFSYIEIAEQQGKKHAAVKTMGYRGIVKLRETMKCKCRFCEEVEPCNEIVRDTRICRLCRRVCYGAIRGVGDAVTSDVDNRSGR